MVCGGRIKDAIPIYHSRQESRKHQLQFTLPSFVFYDFKWHFLSETLIVCSEVEMVAAIGFSFPDFVEQITFHTNGVLLQSAAECNELRSHINAEVHLSGNSDNQIVHLLDLDRATLLAEVVRQIWQNLFIFLLFFYLHIIFIAMLC